MKDYYYDIIVVGGGPAGLSAAYSASKLGADVILFEKEKSIAHNIRTSGVSWLKEISRFDIPSNLYNPVNKFHFISPSNEVILEGRENNACVLNVRGTYQYLAKIAAENGTTIMLNNNVINASFTKEIKKIKVQTMEGEKIYSTKLVIDASGFNSIIARSLGLVNTWQRFGVGAEYECYCENIDISSLSLMVGREYSEAGYGWVFPTGKNRARIGIGVGRPESNQDPIKSLEHIFQKKLKPLNRFGKIQPIEFHLGFIPNQGTRISSIFDGLILVGDSAGQSNPIVLEGIRHAIEFGRLAGKIGTHSLPFNCSKESLIEYERSWKSKIESNINSALKVQKRWLKLSDKEWDEEINIMKKMSMDEFLDFIRADFTPSKLIKLAFNHPLLAAKQLFNTILKK